MPTMTMIALVLFAVTYGLMLFFQDLRPYIACGAALIFIILGFIPGLGFAFTPLDALRAIDWNVLMMIVGTMGTVYLFIDSKMPNRMSDEIITRMPNVKWLIVAMTLFAGIISAFVDNVATVPMVAPVALAVCKKLNISPVPAIICIAVSANLQGAATLVGDTTSILLAKAAKLDFMDFFVDDGHLGMFFIVQVGAILSGLVVAWMFRKYTQPVGVTGKTPVTDKVPAYLLLATIVTLILASFIPYQNTAAPGQFYKPDITNGLICIGYFLIGLAYETGRKKDAGLARQIFKEIDYFTLFLLAGLFVVIGAITQAGVVDMIGQMISRLGGDGSRLSIFLVYTVIVWISVLLSAFIDNIPYTATMLPVVAAVAASLSKHGSLAVDPKLFYYGLLCGATLGGNLTPIGASANIAGLGILRKEGYEVSTGTFMKYGVPFTLVAVTSGYILLWLVWGPK